MKQNKTVLIILVASVCSLYSASPEFDRAFQQAIDKLETERGTHKPGSIVPGLVDELLNHGTKQDVVEAIAKEWSDPSKKRQWTSILSLSFPLGPQTDRTPIVKAMRTELPEVFKMGVPSSLLSVTAGYLYDYGTPEDVEKLKSYLPEVRVNDPAVAREIETTLQISEESKKLRERNQAKGTQPLGLPVHEVPTPEYEPARTKQPNAPKPATPPVVVQQPQRPSWLVWLIVVIAATAGAVWVFFRKSK